MQSSDDLDTGIGERRRARRRSTKANVHLTLESCEVHGEADNISQSGLLFFSEGELRVKIDLEEDGVVKRRTGRLVRAQRMRGASFGWAIEFDAT